MGLKNGLIFGGINSLDYGIYISGDAVFNAPTRKVDLIQIPGRNGDFALDHGRFENIEVSYPAGTFGDDQKDFREKLSDFRNAILSQVGYQRLTDSYHPDEYRLGVYMSGLDVDPAHYNTAGEFILTFNCKPQRWLTSGESATIVSNNGTLKNPTYFESSPLLASLGHGTIEFNGYEIEIDNVEIGEIVLYGSGSFKTSITLDESNLNIGDIITVSPKYIRWYISASASNTSTAYHGAANIVISDTNSDFSTEYSSYSSLGKGNVYFYFNTIYPTISIECGTNSSVTNTVNGHFNIQAHPSGGTVTLTFTQTISYNATTHRIIYSISNVTVSVSNSFGTGSLVQGTMSYNGITGYSTKSAVTDTVYIDCDIGECWTVQGGEIVNLNGVITLGSDLPTLAPGTNTFTFDNTITQLKVTPRWWKV